MSIGWLRLQIESEEVWRTLKQGRVLGMWDLFRWVESLVRLIVTWTGLTSHRRKKRAVGEHFLHCGLSSYDATRHPLLAHDNMLYLMGKIMEKFLHFQKLQILVFECYRTFIKVLNFKELVLSFAYDRYKSHRCITPHSASGRVIEVNPWINILGQDNRHGMRRIEGQTILEACRSVRESMN